MESNPESGSTSLVLRINRLLVQIDLALYTSLFRMAEVDREVGRGGQRRPDIRQPDLGNSDTRRVAETSRDALDNKINFEQILNQFRRIT